MIRRLAAWWSGWRFERGLAVSRGFRSSRRRGEDFGGWLERETALWVKGKN